MPRIDCITSWLAPPRSLLLPSLSAVQLRLMPSWPIKLVLVLVLVLVLMMMMLMMMLMLILMLVLRWVLRM